jgi:predicted ATPase/DNA-binding CsgD family transcriptional regulator
VSTQERGSSLSRREREIVQLVAEGLTDGEIAKRLFLSRRTVEGHVQHLRNKLGFENRTQIATWQRGREPVPEAPRASLAQPVHNLPAQFTAFIGREADLAAVRQLLRHARLVTITGPGGCGKTRAAIQVASEVLLQYPGGVWFIGLGPVTDPDAVPREVAAALDVTGRERDAPLAAVAAELAARPPEQPVLVVLDNCEHLADACAATVDALLRAGPWLTFLATSREPMRVSAEAIWKVGPLSLPKPGPAPPADVLMRSDAARLFLDRVSLIDSEFTLDEAVRSAVAELCRQLDGMPLALELAAARVGLMPLGQIVGHLASRVHSLPRRDAPDRQQSVSAAIAWSYDLLTAVERRVVRRLSVFRGSFTLQAAEALCADLFGADGPGTLDCLTTLVDKSLLQAIAPKRERYRFLELIRRFAWGRLHESGELAAACDRHHAFFFDLAEGAARELTGPAQADWLERLAEDHDNLRAALEAGRDGPSERRLRFALALHRFWWVRGHLGEGRAWVEQALAESSPAPTPLRARVLSVASGLAWQQGDFGRSRAWLEQCLAAWQALGDRSGIQYSLGNLGLIAWRQGDTDAARISYEESLALARELGNERETGVVLINLGLLLAYLGDGAGEGHLLEALRIMRALGDVATVATVLANLGTVAIDRGGQEEAEAYFLESLRMQRYLGARESLADCAEGLATVAAGRGDGDRALRLAGAAEGIRQAIGAAAEPWSQRILRGWVDRARAADGAAARRTWAEGSALPAAEVIALALDE